MFKGSKKILFTSTGNDNLHKILSKRNYKLRIDLKDWNGDTAYAEYDTFAVGSEDTNYALSISGYNGNAGKYRKKYVLFLALTQLSIDYVIQ